MSRRCDARKAFARSLDGGFIQWRFPPLGIYLLERAGGEAFGMAKRNKLPVGHVEIDRRWELPGRRQNRPKSELIAKSEAFLQG